MNLLGKLDWSAVPFDQPIVMFAVGSVSWPAPHSKSGSLRDIGPICGAVAHVRRHKRIGVMYSCWLLMLLRGFADAIMMLAQRAVAAGGAQGYLPPEHFDQIFSAHGCIMIFFMAMPFVIGR
jgi:cytochrome o ubiquinol oxidase subunit 1